MVLQRSESPPWGGHSIEEQILHKTKQRKKNGGQGKRQTTNTSSYTCLKNDQEAILGGAAILQTSNLQPDSLSKAFTARLKKAYISKGAKIDIPSFVAVIHSIETALTFSRSMRLEDPPNEILCQVTSNLEPPELGTLSEASRRFTILIGPVPCDDVFLWARHCCLIHGHTRPASLCGDCIAALIARNKYALPISHDLSKITGLPPIAAAFAKKTSSVLELGVDNS
ncbi:MAG: hypothetical protein Q9175_004115 [Cornicularia normoerica]